jgi:hypothetical protein
VSRDASAELEGEALQRRAVRLELGLDLRVDQVGDDAAVGEPRAVGRVGAEVAQALLDVVARAVGGDRLVARAHARGDGDLPLVRREGGRGVDERQYQHREATQPSCRHGVILVVRRCRVFTRNG